METLFEALEAEIAAQPEQERWRYRAMQIKQKFGELRVYIEQRATPAMAEAIKRAEEAAQRTCEVCSEPGEFRRGGGWFAAPCAGHVHMRISMLDE